MGNHKSSMRKCPNCIKHYTDGYKKGYNDAFKMFEKELQKTKNLRPIQYVLHKSYQPAGKKQERIKDERI